MAHLARSVLVAWACNREGDGDVSVNIPDPYVCVPLKPAQLPCLSQNSSRLKASNSSKAGWTSYSTSEIHIVPGEGRIAESTELSAAQADALHRIVGWAFGAAVSHLTECTRDCHLCLYDQKIQICSVCPRPIVEVRLLISTLSLWALPTDTHKHFTQPQNKQCMASSSSDSEPNLADFLNRHQPEGSQDSDLPAWIQAHVSWLLLPAAPGASLVT